MAKAAISTRATSMSARNGHRAPMARSITRWRMKSAFPARAATVIAVRLGPKATVVLRRRVIGDRRRMVTAALVANIARHAPKVPVRMVNIVPHVRTANIARRALKAIAVRRVLKVPVRMANTVRPVRKVLPARKVIVATAVRLAVAAIRPVTVAAPPSGALRAKS